MGDYQPGREVIERLHHVYFVAVVGPTAAGKSSLIKAAARHDSRLHLVRNHTSRAPRPGETEGEEYYFHGREEMQSRIASREYVQVAPTVLGDLYATAPEDYSTEGTALLPVLSAAVPVFRDLPFASLQVVFVLPPSYDEWQRRIDTRHFTSTQREKRIAEAARSLAFALEGDDILFVINEDLETAVNDLQAITYDRLSFDEKAQNRLHGRTLARQLLDLITNHA